MDVYNELKNKLYFNDKKNYHVIRFYIEGKLNNKWTKISLSNPFPFKESKQIFKKNKKTGDIVFQISAEM